MRSCLAAFLALLTLASARADELAVLSAAAVRPGLLAVPPLFEKATGHRVTLSFGNATAIQNKVKAGERGDIVVLPPKQIEEIAGLLVAGSRADLGVVRLGVAVRAGSGTPAVDTADRFRQTLLASPAFGMPDPADGSTSSVYVAKLLANLGIADAMRAKTKFFADGTKALEALARGEIALTIAPVTSIRVVSGVEFVGALPEELQLKTVYAAALTSRSAVSGPARNLLNFLTSPEVAGLLKSKGIDAP